MLFAQIHSTMNMVVSTNNVLFVLISSEQCGFIFLLAYMVLWSHNLNMTSPFALFPPAL